MDPFDIRQETLPADTAAMGLPRVHVVDDDDSVRTAVARLLSAEGYEVQARDSAESFLADFDSDEHGCIVLDIAMPGRGGLDVQRALAERGSRTPIIFLSGHADVPMCASAMKRGAFEFLTKPMDADVLLAAVERALEHDAAARHELALKSATESRMATLTAREREVLVHVMAGRLNKQIAADLGTAEKTVKVHRARGMAKMHVRSVAELVRIVERSRRVHADLAV